jgi:hypothetical protein
MRLMPFPGGGDDGIDVGIARLPAELLLSARGVGDEFAGIPFPARPNNFRNGMAR